MSHIHYKLKIVFSIDTYITCIVIHFWASCGMVCMTIAH